MNKSSDSMLINAETVSSFMVANHVREVINNATSYGRSEILSKLLDPRRDVDKECGYIETEKLTVADYQLMYDRESVATRVVELEPRESWRVKPSVYEDEDEDTETEFEKAFNELCLNFTKKTWLKPQEETHPIWDIMVRADILSGIGHFGLMLLCIDDGKDFSEPVEGFGSTDNVPVTNEDLQELRDKKPTTKHSLLSVCVFEESLIQINQYETEKANPRYGLPVMYTLTMNDPKNNHQIGIGITTQTERVHWSRVVHIADNLASSKIFGVPRQRPVWNRLMDCRKVYGSSAEGYWQGAFPGLSMETHPQLGGDVTIDAAATKTQLQSYTNTLQRYILSSGMAVKMLSPTVVDPTAQINTYIEAICIKLGCPKRIFVGSERGELSSSQDKDTWEERIETRRTDHVSANIIVPFIDRCIDIGVLPEPGEEGYTVKWEAKDSLSPMDKATVAKTKTEAFGAYVSGGIDTLISPKNYLTKIHDISSDEADQMLEDAIEHINEANPEADDVTVAGQSPAPPVLPELLPGGAPIKVKEGEKLVDPSGKPLNGKQPVQVGGIPVINFETGLMSKLLTIRGTSTIKKSPVINFNPNQPRDSHGRFGSGGGGRGSFPSGGKGLRALKSLGGAGGSTGAQIMEDKDGNKFIMKTADGDKADHIKSEFAAEKAYEAAGVPVPKSQLYESPDTGQVTKLSAFIEGKTLDKLKGDEHDAAVKQVQKHFAVDAALGNWDVVGLTKDNILVGKDGTAYRIDAGGALSFRASGKPKGSAWDEKGSEIDSMRTGTKNPSSVGVFGKMTKEEVTDSVEHMDGVKYKMRDALKKHGNESDAKKVMARAKNITDGELKNINDKYEKQEAAKQAAKKPVTPQLSQSASELHKENLSKVAASSTATPHLGDGDSLKNYIAGKVKGQDLVLKQEHLDKIKFLNPKGIQDGKFYVPAIGEPTDPKYVQFISNLKSTLPAGTEIKKIIVPKHAANNPDVMFSKGKIVPAASVTGTIKSYSDSHKGIAPVPGVETVTHKGATISKYNNGGKWNSETENYDSPLGSKKKVAKKASLTGPANEPYPSTVKPTAKPSSLYNTKYEAGSPLPKLSHTELNNSGHPAWLHAEKSLTTSEKSAIIEWKGSAEGIRKIITNNPPPPPKSGTAKTFLQALEKMPGYEGTVFRGVGKTYGAAQTAIMKAAGVGGTWSDTAPHCCSLNSVTSNNFSGSGGLMMEIKTKTGKSIQKIGGHGGEQEVVGLPNTQYKIVSIEENKKFTHTGSDGKKSKSGSVNQVAHYVVLEEI